MIIVALIGGGIVLFLYAMSQSAQADELSKQGQIDIAPIPTGSGTIPMTAPDRQALVRALAYGIARGEGYYRTGTVPQRQNNPGDIKVGSTIATFLPDSIDSPIAGGGFAKLFEQLNIVLNGSSRYYNLNDTLEDFCNTWTDDGYGTPELSTYVRSVVSALNTAGYAVDSSATLGALARGDFSTAAQAPGTAPATPDPGTDTIGQQLQALSDAGVI